MRQAQEADRDLRRRQIADITSKLRGLTADAKKLTTALEGAGA